MMSDEVSVPVGLPFPLRRALPIRRAAAEPRVGRIAFRVAWSFTGAAVRAHSARNRSTSIRN